MPPPPPDPSDDASRDARLEAVLESVTDGFYALDADWRFVIFNAAAEAYFGVSRDAVLGQELWALFPQGLGTPFERACRAAMTQGRITTFETPSRLRRDRVVELRVAPMRGGGLSVALRDITERRQAEERQRLLVNELNHRVKNALATVQAIAAQSLRDEVPVFEARERFTERLMALARANDVLVAEEWRGADLHAIAELVASPHAGAERFTLSGPPVRLTANAATAMALALHELATNAAKYGALSHPAGRIDLRWAIIGRKPQARFQLVWTESGGPSVRTPTRTGFGSRLIERGLGSELRGDVRLDYASTGLVCTVEAPLGDALTRA